MGVEGKPHPPPFDGAAHPRHEFIHLHHRGLLVLAGVLMQAFAMLTGPFQPQRHRPFIDSKQAGNLGPAHPNAQQVQGDFHTPCGTFQAKQRGVTPSAHRVLAPLTPPPLDVPCLAPSPIPHQCMASRIRHPLVDTIRIQAGEPFAVQRFFPPSFRFVLWVGYRWVGRSRAWCFCTTTQRTLIRGLGV